MSWIAKWEQEDYDGHIMTLEMDFTTKNGAMEFVREKKRVAHDIGRHFSLVSLKEAHKNAPS